MNHAKTKPGASVQRYLDIAEIRDDVVILKDGSLRAVLATSSINFSLKSEDEQNALISSYAQFLNSLDFPLQIVIQSRKLNIEPYITRLRAAEKEQVNDLLRVQITDYIGFVSELVELGEIMSKQFYIVVPYSPISDSKKGFWSRLYELLIPLTILNLKESRLKKYKDTLMQRVSGVQAGLNSTGLRTQILDTQALIELYYHIYNPDLASSEQIQDITKIRTEETLTV